MGADLLTTIEVVACLCFAIYAGCYSMLLLQAARNTAREFTRARRRAWGAEQLAASQSQPVVTVIVPAHQEADAILPAVRSLLLQHWQHLEVIVVPNACTDATMPNLADAYDLQPTAEVLMRPATARGRIVGTWRSAVEFDSA